MASFSAELHVAGHTFPVVRCLYGVYQAVNHRGRTTAKVRYTPVSLTLDVPEGDFLLAWAADPHKRVAASIRFLDANGGRAIESLSLSAAYCVQYEETFEVGNSGTGAYRCVVQLADPSGFTMQAGSSATTFVGPAPGTHGSPPLPPPASVLGKRGREPKLVAGSAEHKAQRWLDYQANNAGNPKAWTRERWEKQYHTNMRNASVGLAREAEYRQSLNAQSKTIKTPLTNRQIDMYVGDELYCGQLKTGKMGLTKQARTEDLPKDAVLVSQGYQVEYILEKGASKPFLAALDRIGVTYKIGPQIP